MQIFDIVEELEKERKKNKELEERIESAINILEKDENKEPIEIILNNVGKALDILKGKE